MKLFVKIILIGAVLAGAGWGIFKLFKSRDAASAPAEDEATPSVVSVQTGTLKLAAGRSAVAGAGSTAP